MKKFLPALLLLIFTVSFKAISLDEIVKAFKSGNAARVSLFFDNTVEITISEKSTSFSKSQAELVLRDFFSTNEVQDFEIIHEGDNAGSQYCIGNLITKNGTFRTTIFVKLKGNKQLIQEIRFEK
jgi:antitoxin component YwqK of YwqJK toxin-antitoxin module